MSAKVEEKEVPDSVLEKERYDGALMSLYGDQKERLGYLRGRQDETLLKGINLALVFVAGLFTRQLISDWALKVIVVSVVVFVTVVVCAVIVREARK